MIVLGLPQSAATGSSTLASGMDIGSWAVTWVSFCNVKATAADAFDWPESREVDTETGGKGEQAGGLVGGLVGMEVGGLAGGEVGKPAGWWAGIQVSGLVGGQVGKPAGGQAETSDRGDATVE